ncbi:hypothetical protein BDZ45DRAFT_697220 [Acephala macrosclerotiorum]|nr:hypothetical protein BDZ45DRAFT_697220 [Acephala macrosclerotiorum]
MANSEGTSQINKISAQNMNYQDEAASHESRLKAIWDEQITTGKKKEAIYKSAFVLLLSWDDDVDDLHTRDEVAALEQMFKNVFKYETVRGVLNQNKGSTAQAQVNYFLAKLVHDHDDPNNLFIVYYAGHGRPEESQGGLRLAGKRSLVKPTSELHEIVWGSAEHNIKATRSDVLVIFDCCHAGELEKSIRSTGTHRAFEYLAATSANSTTMKPGPRSFTTALIWAVKSLVKSRKKSFSTQQLLSTIFHAPEFPKSQSPRLSERGSACLRRIVLAPLSEDASEQAENDAQEEEEIITTDLNLRFVFNRSIDQTMVENLATELRTLISADDFKTATILWEGIDCPNPVARFYGRRWQNIANARRRNLLATPVEPRQQLTPGFETSGSASTEVNQVVIPSQEPLNAELDIDQDVDRPEELAMEQDVQPSPTSAVPSLPNPGPRSSNRKRKREINSTASQQSLAPPSPPRDETPSKRPRGRGRLTTSRN